MTPLGKCNAPLAIFCKSFRDDLEHFARLADSVERHNPEAIPFIASAPAADHAAFRNHCGSSRFELVADEASVRERLTNHGWINQQIVKMSVWQLQRAEAMLMVDSDFRFLRDVCHSDLLESDGTPRLVLSRVHHIWEEGAPEVRAALTGDGQLSQLDREECRAWGRAAQIPAPRGFIARHTRFRHAASAQLWFGRPGPRLMVMAGPILAYRSQRSFYEEFLRPSRITYAELLRDYPWEYDWLAEWTLARHSDAVHPMTPPFICIRSDDGIAEARAAGVTSDSIARHYLGVALAARHASALDF